MKNILIFSLGIILTVFSIEKTYAQPANDQCSGSTLVTPNGSCVAGTTVAANDNWTGAVGCQSGGNVNAHLDVWYRFVSTGTVYTGTVTASAPFAGNVEFILVSSATGCTGPFTIVGSACGPSPLSINITGLTNGATYYFTISNQGNGTPGPFLACSTTSTPPVNCTDNDDCASPTPITYTTGVQTCLTDCNTGANSGPDFTGTNCYDFPDETVWYSVATGASTASIDVLINSAALTSPYFTVFTTTDCLNYTIINCTEGAIGSGTVSSNVLVSANTTYLIAISDQAGAAGNFDLCITVNNDNSACNTNNSLVVTATSMGSPFAGPYQPSEVVTFRYTITNWQQINCNYLQGIVPEFGDCWDPISFDAQGKPVSVPVPLVTAGVMQACPPGPPCAWSACVGTPDGTWSWFPSGAVTYNNIVGSLPPNSPMPAGWYFLTSYNPATGSCNGDPVDPDNSYGDGDFPDCGTNTLDWTVTFQLQARNAISGCGSSLTDCGVIVRTYADGELGVWNNLGCTADATGAGFMSANLCCTPAPTVTTPVTYCQNDVASPLTATGTNLLWYAASTGGVGSATAPTPSTVGVGTTNYYVSQTTGGCESGRALIAVTIYNPATANANSDQIICAGSTVTLAGSIGGGAASGTWTGGTGTFTPNATTLNATYTPSAADISAGSVTLTLTSNDPAGPCNAASDVMVITINPASTVNANVDQTICSGSTVTLAGIIGGSATSATWSGGGGTFTPNATTLGATYTPTAANIAAGTVTLTLTTNDPAGPCSFVTDQMVITINNPATTNANSDQIICAGSTVSLAGSIGGSATGATWSGGSGTFTPNATTLAATYTPSAADITAGTVTLTLTTNDPAGPCPAVSDQMIITLNTPATVNANINQTICANTTVILAGSIGGSASSATWTGGSGTFAPSANTLNATYTPSAGDITAGTVTLTLTSNDPAGPCLAVNDQMVITITPLDNASFTYSSSTFCQTGTDPTATITGLGGGIFSSTAGLIILNTATGLLDLSASTLGTYTITYTTNGPCPNSSTYNITITTAPSAAFSYSGPYCQGEVNPFPTFGPGASAGTFNSSVGLNFVNVNTGEINLSTSTPGTYTVTNDIAAGGGCSAANASNTVTINTVPTVSANSDQTICSGSAVTLAGTMGGSATSATWSGSTGTFNPGAGTLNAVFTPSAADITAGTVTLTLTTDDPAGPCISVSDQIIITINTPAISNANSDQIICAGSTVSLSGSIGGGASSGTWSGGTGSFSPNATTLNATYTPSVGDISSGSVTITLTSDDPAGPCSFATDQILITINPLATVSAGINQSICEGSSAVLTGIIGGGASSATWSGGSGTFTPNVNTLNATYTPSAADISSGSVTLILTTDDPSGPCSTVSDQTIITINTIPTLNAGSDISICEGSSANLSGIIGGGASSATWSGGTGTYVPNVNSLNAVYTPSALEILSGTVTLTLTTDDPAGPCIALTDQVIISISPSATVSAGSDQNLCEGSDISLAGTIGGGATSASWSGGSGTYLPDANTLNATYTPTVLEITSGTLTLTITTDDPTGPCSSVTDQVVFTIFPATNSFAGVDQAICSGSDIILDGQISGGATSGSWSGGSGIYNPDANTLNAVYTPSVAEIASGIVNLTLTTNDPIGPCSFASDQVVITIDQIATVNAGIDVVICEGDVVNLSGTISGSATTATWTGGTGTFLPDANTLNATYTPSAGDISLGVVTLTLSTDDPIGPCLDVNDQFVINITQADDPTFNYSSATFCQSGTDPVAVISGTIGGTFSSSAGLVFLDVNTGLIDLSASSLNTYTITYTTNGACPRTSTFDLTLTNAPTAAFSYSGPFCQTSTPDPSPTLAVGALSGMYSSFPLGLVINPVNGTINLAMSTVGTYNVYNNVAASGGCSAAIDSTVVTIDLPALAFAGTDTVICSYNLLSLSGSMGGSASSLFWTTSGNGTFSNPTSANSNYTPSANDILNGIVTLTITTDNPSGACNSVSDSLSLLMNLPPDLTMGPDTILNCLNPSITISCITTFPAVTYNWSGPGIVSSGNTANPVVNTFGTYTVTVTNVGDGCYSVDSLVVGVNSNIPNVSAGNDTTILCATPSIILNGSSTTSGVTFNWSGPGIVSGSNTTNPVVNLAGYYVLSVTDTTNGCLATDSVNVAPSTTPPPANAGVDIALCLGQNSQLNASGGVSYLWSPSVGLSSDTIFNPIANPVLTTVYIVLVTDSLGCSASDSVVVTINNVPNTLITGSSSVCQGQTISYSTTGATGNTYLWTVNGGTPTTGSNSSINIAWNTLGSGNIVLVETSTSNCVASDTSDIIINETPVAVAGIDTSNCLGDSIQISASGSIGTAPFNYIWDNGLGTGVSHSVSPLTNTTYTVTVSNSINCTSTDNVTITISPIPVFSISGVNTTCSDYTDGSAQSSISSATQPVAYLWSNGLTTASINNIGKGIYYLTISDASGCFSVDSIEIKSQDLFECLEIPTVFSPNGDGKNDTWEIRHIELFPDASVEIYNRWGDLLYKADSYSDPSKWWDGKFKGSDLPLGSFVYIIILTPDREPIQGVVSIVR